MSYDPFGYGSDVTPPEEGIAAPLPGDASYARQRVQAPAIALIVVGIVNLLTMLFIVGDTIRTAFRSPDELQKDVTERLDKLGQALPGMREAYEKQQEEQNQSPEALKIQALVVNSLLCALGLLAALLTLFGGIRMRSLRSYALSIAGAISAAIPCLTCSGTCCFGEFIGLWALIVLLNAEVKAAFL
jgi:hypothetical protein